MLTISSARKIARLNRRQRKKHHVGEFQEMGFTLNLRFKEPQPEVEVDQFWEAFIPVLDELRLLLVGLGGPLPILVTDAFVSAETGSVSDVQRDAVLAWLRASPVVAEATATEWQDAWYGWNLLPHSDSEN